jgi:hypothetical protein
MSHPRKVSFSKFPPSELLIILCRTAAQNKLSLLFPYQSNSLPKPFYMKSGKEKVATEETEGTINISWLIPKDSFPSTSRLSGLSAYSPVSCSVTVFSLVGGYRHSAKTDFLRFHRRSEIYLRTGAA